MGWKPDSDTCNGTVLSVIFVPFAGDWMLTFIAVAQGGTSIAICGLGEEDEVALPPPHATAVMAAIDNAPIARPHGIGDMDMLTPRLQGLVTKRKPESPRLFPAKPEFNSTARVGISVGQRRQQNPVRRAVRRPVRRGFTWRSLAWIGGGAAVAVAAVSLMIASATNHPTSPLPVPSVANTPLVRGQAPPDFNATTFDGRQLSLSGLKGHPVLINFFASWCTQCARELPFMEQSYERHQAAGFVIVGVNGLETGDGVGFYHRLGLTFPAVYDPGNPGKIAIAYNVTNSLPLSVFIDKTGRVDLIQIGALTPELLEQEIQRLS